MGTDSNANPVFHLTHGLVPSKTQRLRQSGSPPAQFPLPMDDDGRATALHRHQRAVRRFSLFEQQERDAIVDYLRFMASDGCDGDDIGAALAGYWLKTAS
ncbi:MAG: hypothetical protein A3K19_00125 [Lentisphaerae bacterium RIFOXYB12_FULL_65_16]|nr:MAG: hypothetical protein A3K18_10350 [Lentisphaerae bacterium RIFOXYA12_64_32]OGV86202.1 MAG: hypothetical protein A3K19_00125 [Lentisphaerae bacterium RIFOXYB12_FULL_65_16]